MKSKTVDTLLENNDRAKQIAEEYGLVSKNAIRAIAAALAEGEAKGRRATPAAEHAGPAEPTGTTQWPAIYEHVRPRCDA
jgi:hypothetical protein